MRVRVTEQGELGQLEKKNAHQGERITHLKASGQGDIQGGTLPQEGGRSKQ